MGGKREGERKEWMKGGGGGGEGEATEVI